MSRSTLLPALVWSVIFLTSLAPLARAQSVAPPNPFVDRPAPSRAPDPAGPPSAPPAIDPSALFKHEPERAPDPDVARGQAATYTQQGIERLREGNHGTAIVDLTESIRLDPGLSISYCTRGEAYLATGQTDLAMKDFDEAVRLAPSDSLARCCRADARLKLNMVGAAMEDLDAAVRAAPSDPHALTARGHALVQLGRADEAFADLELAIKLAANPASALHGRASLRNLRGDFAGAEADATAAIQADPSFAPSYLARAFARAMQKQWDGAIADSEAHLRAFPTAGFSYYLMAMAHHSKGEHAAALADLDNALERDRDSSPSLALRALLLAASADVRLRDGRKSLEAARRACTVSGRKTHDPLYALAAAHAELGDFRAAVVEAVAAATRPSNLETRLNDARLILAALACRPLREPVAGAAPQPAVFGLGIRWDWNEAGGPAITLQLSSGRGFDVVVSIVPGLRLALASLAKG